MWVVFNEFVVTRVSDDEALHLDIAWKTPCLLYYERIRQGSADRGK